MSAAPNCAICGRTILAGERVHGFVEAGEERSVCELCVAGAERLGWRPAGEPEPERPASGHERRWRLRGLLHRRSRRQGVPAARRFQSSRFYSEEKSGNDAPPKPEAVPARPRPRPASDFDSPTPFERAAARFNSSEAGHTVVGLVRTLGRPWVSIGAAAGAHDEVRITIAWELSWYQWGVDIGDELRPVFEIDKGREIDQLDPAARQWNAGVGEDGRLTLAEPAAKR
ncbi:MAG TPA: hypothetical protein VFP21_11160 [Solirubrobacterales bacterium]|nr:hypothetical protein [Solirubrobacterales bacterium]